MADLPDGRDGGLKPAARRRGAPRRSNAATAAGARDDPSSASALLQPDAINAINQRIFETSIDLIFVADRRGSFIRISPSALTILGYRPDEMVGRSAAEFLYPEDLDNTRNEMRLARYGAAARSFECRYLHKLGGVVTLSWRGVWSAPEGQYFFIGRDVTEHKETERRLREAQQMDALLREGIDGMPEGFAIWDEEARLVICNKSYQRLFAEVSATIVPGVRFETVLRDGLARGKYTDAKGREEEWVAQRLREHRSQGGAIEQRLNDGRWVLVSKHQMSNGRTAGLRVDITALKTTQQALAESERSFLYLFENSPLPMWVYEPESLRFLAVNHAAVSSYGFSRREFLAMRIGDIGVAEDLDRVMRMVADAPPYSQTIGWRHRTKNGRVLDVDVFSHELSFDGKVARMVVALDVTARTIAEAQLAAENAERRRAEDEVRALNEELEGRVAQRTAELETVNRELESFAYSVSHDLRAPLRHMDGFSQALIEDYGGALDETAKGFLRRIRAGSVRMGQLIDDLLKLSRASRGGLERERVDLSAMALAILDELRESHPDRHVAIDVAPDMTALADARLMQVALRNLLGNSWKFTMKNPDARIEFGMAADAEPVVYVIRDNGVGFDMTYAHKLFAPFQRLHTSEEFEGTGIGLATVSRVFHRHGGKVEIESAVGKGTAVRFTI